MLAVVLAIMGLGGGAAMMAAPKALSFTKNQAKVWFYLGLAFVVAFGVLATFLAASFVNDKPLPPSITPPARPISRGVVLENSNDDTFTDSNINADVGVEAHNSSGLAFNRTTINGQAPATHP